MEKVTSQFLISSTRRNVVRLHCSMKTAFYIFLTLLNVYGIKNTFVVPWSYVSIFAYSVIAFIHAVISIYEMKTYSSIWFSSLSVSRARIVHFLCVSCMRIVTFRRRLFVFKQKLWRDVKVLCDGITFVLHLMTVFPLFLLFGYAL